MVKCRIFNIDIRLGLYIAIFQKLEYPKKTTDRLQVTDKLLSHNTPLHDRDSNSQL